VSGGPQRLVLATANPDKVAEIAAILGPDWELVSRPAGIPDVVEDGDTLEANARLKATAVAEATSMAAIADDTGLEVDALGGAPGVHSSRYAGPDGDAGRNVAKLLAELEGTAPAERTARFRTVALARFPDGREVIAHGTVEGVITDDVAGHGGFGYDPVFVPTGPGTDGRTFAEMTAADKHAVSHRGRAFRALAERLTGA
jgi:XTP/dITP diphosphohydrolase